MTFVRKLLHAYRTMAAFALRAVGYLALVGSVSALIALPLWLAATRAPGLFTIFALALPLALLAALAYRGIAGDMRKDGMRALTRRALAFLRAAGRIVLPLAGACLSILAFSLAPWAGALLGIALLSAWGIQRFGNTDERGTR